MNTLNSSGIKLNLRNVTALSVQICARIRHCTLIKDIKTAFFVCLLFNAASPLKNLTPDKRKVAGLQCYKTSFVKFYMPIKIWNFLPQEPHSAQSDGQLRILLLCGFQNSSLQRDFILYEKSSTKKESHVLFTEKKMKLSLEGQKETQIPLSSI